MKVSLSERWASLLASDGSSLVKHAVPLRAVQRVLSPALQQAGYAMPLRRNLADALAAGLEPLEVVDECGPGGFSYCRYWRLLNLVWQPLLMFIEGLAAASSPAKPEGLALNEAALLSEMEGIVPSPGEHLTMYEWVDFIRETLLRLVDVEVPTRLINAVVSGTAYIIYIRVYICIDV